MDEKSIIEWHSFKQIAAAALSKSLTDGSFILIYRNVPELAFIIAQERNAKFRHPSTICQAYGVQIVPGVWRITPPKLAKPRPKKYSDEERVEFYLLAHCLAHYSHLTEKPTQAEISLRKGIPVATLSKILHEPDTYRRAMEEVRRYSQFQEKVRMMSPGHFSN